MIGQTISHYRIQAKLGEGGMGIVYKAHDTTLDRLVALKFLSPHLTGDPTEKERFYHEARAAAALTHPNIAVVHEIGEHENQIFIAMEFVEGKTLKQLVESETPSVKKVLDIAIQVCEGLAAAHEKGIVHRDIKSDNIIVTPKGQVKIMDFGLAKVKGATKLTKAGSTVGTAAYMSPEQAQGEEVDQRSDIFSFGVVLYELLTGKLPFRGEHQAALMYSIVNEEPPPVARFNEKVTPELERIVAKALEKEREERYQHIDDLLADVRRGRKSLEYVKTSQISKEIVISKSRKKVLPIVIPASIVFILAVLFLIFKPFKVEIGPQKGAIAQENSLAIMYFENMTDIEDEERLGEIVTNLLIADLSQTIQVVSSQRLYDILKLLGKEGVKLIDRNVATEVATKANAKWMLLGSILQVRPRMVVTTQLVDVKSGALLGSQKITGETGEEVFSLVDKLTVEIKKDLSLPSSTREMEELPVANVTTHSQEAYRYCLEGVENVNKLYLIEATKSLRKSVAFDSTFAMAYYWLAYANYVIGDLDAAREAITAATRHMDKTSQKERLYITGMSAYISGDYAKAVENLQELVRQYPEEKVGYFLLGTISHNILNKNDDAIRYLNRAIEIDPLFKMAYNMLAYTYDAMGDFDKSIWAINKYIELAPDEANPYDTRADLYAWNGKLDQAIESYRKALERNPNFYASLAKLGRMCLFRLRYTQAESCFKELSSFDIQRARSYGRAHLALIPVYRGELNKAVEILNDGLSADRLEQVEDIFSGYKHMLKAAIQEEQDKQNLALKETEIALGIFAKVDQEAFESARVDYAYYLARVGKITEAEEVAQAVKKDAEGKDATALDMYWWALGAVELGRKNPNAAVGYLEKVTVPDFSLRFRLGKAYLESGALDKAVAILEKALLRYDVTRAVDPISAVKAYYLLGMAYEGSGWNDKAIEKYEEFLNIWKDADPGLPEVADAKERLTRLSRRL